MNLEGYIACICEGAAEKAVMDLLLENNKLIFRQDELLYEEIIECRSGSRFEQRYLRKGFNKKITILRILDSRRESFKLSKAYRNTPGDGPFRTIMVEIYSFVKVLFLKIL